MAVSTNPADHAPAAGTRPGGHKDGFRATSRKDHWATEPLAVLIGLSLFIIYATWAAFQGNHYYVSPYLSPFYSPLLWVNPDAAGAAPVAHAWFGSWPQWWPAFIPISPSILILPFPGAFRFTCYYYRKAYYRSFAGMPPGCAVGPIPQHPYKGETKFLLFQNLHRYAMYIALIFVVVLWTDAVRAFFKDGRFGIGVGTVVLIINAALLSGYTFGCHSLRHLVGGRLDCFSCSSSCEARHSLWSKITGFNERHMQYAWMSLFWVAFTDFYVRMVSLGYIPDFNTWGR
ncbi:MAG: succinate dehydrogenase [Armatimonadetes bacterium]|nr:succinate dehydrogenase [Armatimonadota bacterium]